MAYQVIHTSTQVRVYGSIASRTDQVLVLAVRNVKVRIRVAVLLRQPEINHVHLTFSLADPCKKVVGLDIAVDERPVVNALDAGDELVSEQQDSLEGELAFAEVEAVFERRT